MACYVKTSDGFKLWNKVVSNKFYEEYCGNDYKDWLDSGLFKLDAVYGEGIHT